MKKHTTKLAEPNGNLYIVFPNIIACQYAQNKLVREFGFELFGEDIRRDTDVSYHSSEKGVPHFTDRICIADKMILWCEPTADIDGNEIYDKSRRWIDWRDGLGLLTILKAKI